MSAGDIGIPPASPRPLPCRGGSAERAKEGPHRRHRAAGAQGHGPAAKLLTVVSEEQVGALHRCRVAGQEPRQLLLHGAVARGIARALDSKPQAQRHVGTIGRDRSDGNVRAKEEYLVDTGVADRRKAFERLPRVVLAGVERGNSAAREAPPRPWLSRMRVEERVQL